MQRRDSGGRRRHEGPHPKCKAAVCSCPELRADLVSSAAELYFLPGTVNFGAGGNYRLDWDTEPEVTLDMELRPQGVTIYARLMLQKDKAGVEVTHVAFNEPAADPADNTAFDKSLQEARYVKSGGSSAQHAH